MIEAGAGEGLEDGHYDWGVDSQDGSRSSPVLAACKGNTEGHIKVLELLIENGASLAPDQDAEANAQESFLHVAVKLNSFEVVEILVNAGAPVNYYDPFDVWGRSGHLTPLDEAMMEEPGMNEE